MYYSFPNILTKPNILQILYPCAYLPITCCKTLHKRTVATITLQLYHSYIYDIDWHDKQVHYAHQSLPCSNVVCLRACGVIGYSRKPVCSVFNQLNCIVIPESDTGFHIAFKMLDIDGSETVDKMEFQKVGHVFSFMLQWIPSANVLLKCFVLNVNVYNCMKLCRCKKVQQTGLVWIV